MHIRSVWSHFLCCFAHFIQITQHRTEQPNGRRRRRRRFSLSTFLLLIRFAYFFSTFSLFLFFKWISSFIRRVCQLCEHFAVCCVCCMRYATCAVSCIDAYKYSMCAYTPCQLPDVSLSTVCRLFFSLSRDFIHLFSINLKNALVAPKSVSVCERKRVANWNDTAHSTMIVIILYVSGIIAISKCKQ